MSTKDIKAFRDGDLIQLAYVSKSVGDIGTLSLMNLLEDCINKNRSARITGVLFYHNGIFGQIIEGYPKFIDSVWQAIQSDPRHQDIRLLSVELISQRKFSNWAMRFLGSDQISRYVPELKMHFDGNYSSIPHEIITLMQSVSEDLKINS